MSSIKKFLSKTKTSPVIIEVGVVRVDHNLVTVDLIQTYINPIIILSPPSYNGGYNCVPRIQNKTSSSFTIFIQEDSGGDVTHAVETVYYLIIESGQYQLSSGQIVEAFEYNQSGSVSLTRNFLSSFDSVPALFTQIQTNNQNKFLKVRPTGQNSISGYAARLEADEMNDDEAHSSEVIGYLAIDYGENIYSNFTDGTTYLLTPSNVVFDENWLPISNLTFQSTPRLFAEFLSYTGKDPATIRFRNISPTRVDILIQEDTTVDTEVEHSLESINLLLIEGEGLITL